MPRYVATLQVPAAGVADLAAYEAAVLPLLAAHGGTLEQRLRAVDGLTEIHVLHFDGADGLAAYRADPRRLAAQPLWTRAGATASVIEVVAILALDAFGPDPRAT